MAKQTLTEREKTPSTWFCFVSNIPEQREELKKRCLDCTVWSWIDHDPDDEDGKPHTHFLIRRNGSRTIGAIAKHFGIPSNFVQDCRKVTAYRRYFMHLDNPEKKQYTISDVHTNCKLDFEIAIEGNEQKDIFALYRDYSLLRSGRITPQEFIQMNYVEMSKMSFQSKIKMFSLLDTAKPDATT